MAADPVHGDPGRDFLRATPGALSAGARRAGAGAGRRDGA
jgi:hypothetical protein